MKRKADSQADGRSQASSKKTKTTKNDAKDKDVRRRFRAGLFEKPVLASYSKEYAASSPYKHAVIHDLVDDALLRSVRDEIRANVQFSPKETDIYKIHQSGDLANLDGLDDESMAKLPSLRALRDAVYSDAFRSYVSAITGCGPLSGRKTDMAINVYTPGCYLLCHDDVIGSRRVSYILYLTDPDKPWRPEWGGALRLFPVQELRGKDGQVAKTPLPEPVKVIPPAWNQLSFFAVQPGESFHDVEEVFHAKPGADDDGGRVRMAISGWFHIPQAGEQGYVEGEEERNAENSSLMQLQGDPAQYDVPCPRPLAVDNPSTNQQGFDEADLEFLLKYMAPTYLTPDTLEQVSDHFSETSSISLANVLSNKFARRLKQYLAAQELLPMPGTSADMETKSPWRVARPPHKHRYLFQQPSGPDQLRTSQEESPITELLDIFLPSRQFRYWLQMATDCVVESCDLTARRFRRGQDYTLATGHDGRPRLELNLGITPTSGWGDDDDNEEAEVQDKGKGKGKGKGKAKAKAKADRDADGDHDVGGHEVYMAGDDGDDADDAAVYKSSGEDDNILFFQAAAWNKMTLVLRDSGTLRFVKYVSSKAPGDRWDVSGVFEVEDEDAAAAPGGESEDEEEFNGFSDPISSESDSD
ncbi:hypothetical protein XA68_13762 [Ophiocordyceps unilateralis]|uniref:uS12 prolyl 3,4-dihydroxylase n=1 Tax=Ophiocordyceps unilateralis TaxID=268505 RepID=A0A2A9PBP8_OPHUN|nr:hypothetical protein XA68_13762 [Ophiocordyceps unilateralis]